MNTPLPFDLLPEKLREIADECGEDVMWAVWENYGGVHLRPPKKFDVAHHTAQKMGVDLARRLADKYPGELINVPLAKEARLAVRNARIRQLYDSGVSGASISRMFGITERTVWNVVAKPEQVMAHFDLFDMFDLMGG